MENILREKSTFTDKIKVIFDYSLPVKLIISSLIAPLIGTGYFAIISNCSIYYYSIVNGFRLPSEGSPFITIVVSAITFTVLFTAGILFASIYGLTRFMNTNYGKLQVNYIKIYKWAKINDYKWIQSLSSNLLKSSKKQISLKFLFTCSGIAFILPALLLTFLPGGPFPLRIYLTIPTFMGVYPIFLSLPFMTKKYSIATCSALSLLYIVLIPIMSMDANFQSKFLSMIKYGGETNVALHFAKDDVRQYNLVFRSSQSLFVRTGVDKKISEFPLSEVKSIDYLPSE